MSNDTQEQEQACGDEWAGWASGDACRLLGLSGVAVTAVNLAADGSRVVHLVTTDPGAAACPKCGVFATSCQGFTVTRPRDIPYGTAGIGLVCRKRRWRCAEAACERGSFTESVPAIPARSRLTRRLRCAAGTAVASSGRSVAEVAGHYRVSWPVVHAAFTAHVDPVLAEELPAVAVLGIAD